MMISPRVESAMSSWPIARRMALLVIVALASLVALATAYFVSERAVSRLALESQRLASLSDAVQKIDHAGGMLRVLEKDFIRNPKGSAVETFTKLASDVDARFADGVRQYPEYATELGAARTAFGQYRERVIAMAEQSRLLGLTEKEGLQGRLRASVHAAETRMAEQKLDALTVKMLMMRRHEKDFMLRGEERYLGEVEKRFAEALPLIAASPIEPAQQAELNKLLEAYVADFRTFVAGSKARDAAIAGSDAAFAAFEPELEKLNARKEAVAAAAAADLAATQGTARWTVIVAAVLGLVLALAFGVIVTTGISRPIRALTALMRRLADGDKSVAIAFVDRGDEIGEMARAVEVFKANAIEAERLDAEQKRLQAEAEAERMRQLKAEAERTEAERLADERRRDERRREEERHRAEQERLRAEQDALKEQQRRVELARMERLSTAISSFEAQAAELIQAVTSAATELEATARELTVSATRTRAQAADVASASDDAAGNVQTVAAAAEELSASIGEIGRQVQQSSDAVAKAVGDAERTNVTVQSLAVASGRIGEILDLIGDIAGRTNLLALNATIEAARAGEAGKGFAVVASEVKTLATQTAKATDEVASQIAAMREATQSAVSAISEIGSTIHQVDGISSAIAAAVQQQSAATSEIARNVAEAASGAETVKRTIGGVADAAGGTGAAAEQVLATAGDLAHRADTLRRQIEAFLGEVKAA